MNRKEPSASENAHEQAKKRSTKKSHTLLDVAPRAVDLLVEEARRLPHVGHDEARIAPRLAVCEADDLGLDHDAARA